MKRNTFTSPTAKPSRGRLSISGRSLPLLLALAVVATAAIPASALGAPSASTNSGTNRHHTSVVFTGHLDPDADPGITACNFEWGTTVAYGNNAPCNEGNVFAAPADVSANVNNLTPGTTYHFRLHVETTSSGPLDGIDQSFRPDTFPITHPEIVSFGPDGTASSSFTDLFGVAFNQSARELFAFARGTNEIFGFDASAPPTYTPLATFDPLSVPGVPSGKVPIADQPDVAVDSTALPSAGNVYYVVAANLVAPPEPAEYKIYGYDISGSPLPGFPVQTATGISCGAAVDSAGHLWVTNHQNTIEEFSSSGVKLGSITTPSQFSICKLGFDSNDDMFVVGQNGPVWKYTAASGYTSASEFAPAANNNVAVDTVTHNVYTGHFPEFSEGRYPYGPRVYEYDSNGHFLGDFAVGLENNRVVVDSTNHDVFVTGQDDKIHVFDATVSTVVKRATVTTGQASAITGSAATIGGAVDPEGLSVTDCHIGWGKSSENSDTYENNVPCSVGSGSGDVPVSASITGLAAGTVYHFRVFASTADGTNAGNDISFTTNFPPSVTPSPATNVTNAAADLNGQVNPKGSASSYRFEWGPTPAYGNTVPVPDGDAGSGEGNVPVSAHIGGLQSNTRYYWRLSAQSINGSVVVEGASFLTLGMPVAETTGAPIRTTTSAQLGGRVAPRGFATDYFFEYGSGGSCDANLCAASTTRSAGSGAVTRLVSEEIEGLEPNTTYHYRIVAQSSQSPSPVYGEDMTVTTQASEAPLSHGHFPGPAGSDRAYEQISPPNTGGNAVSDGAGFSADGDRALFQIAGGTPLSEEGNLFSIYFSQRTETDPHEGDWRPKSILPPRSNEIGNPHWFLNPDASLSNVSATVLNEASQEVKLWRLSPQVPATKLAEGMSQEINLGLAGVSEDGSRLVALLFGSHDPDHPIPGLVKNLYDVTAGVPRLIGLMPDGSVPSCGATLQSGSDVTSTFSAKKHAISADGSLAFFDSQGSACGEPLRVYLRDLESEETKLVSPVPVSGPDCDAAFLSSAPDAVFFWTKSRLSAEDTEPNSCGPDGLDSDIYRYALDDETVRCVTCVVPGVDVDLYRPIGNGNTMEYMVVSEDGSRVYFQSPHPLTLGAAAVSGEGNLYRVNVKTGDLAWVGGPDVSMLTAAVAMTPDGATVLFGSASSSLNPVNGANNGGTKQYYRYDDHDRSLICLTCPIDGSAPRGPVGPIRSGDVQGMTQITSDGKGVVFATPTPLVGADQNTSGLGGSADNGLDIYEWRDGRYLLITDGLTNTTPGTGGPSVKGISSDGRDVFFAAPGQYTPDALDGYQRLYDARVGGGFNYPVPEPPCPLEVCQGTPKGAPEEQAPGSANFAGPGNLSKPARPKCAKGTARRKGRCVAKKPKRAHKASHKRASNNRRTAR